MARQRKPWTPRQYRTFGIYCLIAGAYFTYRAYADVTEDGFPYAFIACALAAMWLVAGIYSVVKATRAAKQ